MKKKWSFLILAAVMIALIGGAVVLYQKYSGELTSGRLMEAEVVENENKEENQTEEQTGESAKEPAENETVIAPDFTVYDGDGNEVKLSDFIGKPVVLNFWASWCGPCQMEMPDFEEAYQTYGEEIHFLMINMTDGSRETVDTAKAFIEDSEYSFPVYFDSDMDAAMNYGVSGIPCTFFINAKGYAITYANGAIDNEILNLGIEMITEDSVEEN